MLAFNLLPGRDEILRFQQLRFKKILFSAGLSALLIITILQIVVLRRISVMQDNIKHLQEIIIDYQSKHQKFKAPNISSLINPQWLIGKTLIDKLFLGSNESFNHSLCFTSLKHESTYLVATGRAQTAFDLTEFLQHGLPSSMFSEIQIQHLDNNQQGWVEFGFQATLAQKKG